MPATGPDFISLQARGLDSSQTFYEPVPSPDPDGYQVTLHDRA